MSKLSQLFRRAFRGTKSSQPERQVADQPKRSFALNDLDLKLEPYLAKPRGFFIEAGANDGITQSNTLYFEKYYGWDGLLIEPIPELAQRCRVHRPNCRVINTALVPFAYQEPSIEMHSCNLMSLVKGAMKSPTADLEHITRGCEIQNVPTSEVRVPATPLSELLDQFRIRNIDLLSLDVEGYELDVLQGLDLNRHRPQWMLIEARFRDEIDTYLKSHYRPVASLSHHDVLYQAID